MLRIYEFRENWCKERHAFLMGVNGITVVCVNIYGILRVKNTLVNYVYRITQNTI
jgi:hypothetical protein